MGFCYSGNHIAWDDIYTKKTTCKIKEPQQKYRHGNGGRLYK